MVAGDSFNDSSWNQKEYAICWSTAKGRSVPKTSTTTSGQHKEPPFPRQQDLWPQSPGLLVVSWTVSFDPAASAFPSLQGHDPGQNYKAL